MSGARPAVTHGDAAIKVVVRLRPPLSHERTAHGGRNDTVVCDLQQRTVTARVLIGDKPAEKHYSFDRVFNETATQEEVYHGSGVDEFVKAAAAGVHCTIFAYGQTGSGKTHTMEGYRYVPCSQQRGIAPAVDFEATPPAQLGITPRAVQALFDHIAADTGRRYAVQCSFIQLYREQAHDLLSPLAYPAERPEERRTAAGGSLSRRGEGAEGGGPLLGAGLKLRWSKAEEFYLEGELRVTASSPQQAVALYRHGVANKVMASHALNASSSRSHALFTLHVTSWPAASHAGSLEAVTAKLTLVDLAGSERQGVATGADGHGTLREESIAINKSLFTLRQVITSLAAAGAGAGAGTAASAPSAVQSPGGSAAASASSSSSSHRQHPPPTPPPPQQSPQQPHVPYRDSKLTSLLKASLGGSGMALMVACLAPGAARDGAALDESLSTLEYAHRTKRITNKVVVNEDPRARLIRELRAEVALLREQLQAGQEGMPAAATAGIPASPLLLHGNHHHQQQQQQQAGQGPQLAQAGSSGGSPEAAAPTAALQLLSAADGGASGAPAGPGVVVANGSGLPGPGGAPLSGRGDGAGGGLGDAGGGSAQLLLGGGSAASAVADVDVLAGKLVEAVRMIHSLSSRNQSLFAAYQEACGTRDQLRLEFESLLDESSGLREQLAGYQALVAGPMPGGPGGADTGGGSGGGGQQPTAAATASSAALIELHSLRQENAMLHGQLRSAQLGLLPAATGAAAAAWPGSRWADAETPLRGGAQPATANAYGGGSGSSSSSPRSARPPVAAARGTTPASSSRVTKPPSAGGNGSRQGNGSGPASARALGGGIGIGSGGGSLTGLSVAQMRAALAGRQGSKPPAAGAAQAPVGVRPASAAAVLAQAEARLASKVYADSLLMRTGKQLLPPED